MVIELLLLPGWDRYRGIHNCPWIPWGGPRTRTGQGGVWEQRGWGFTWKKFDPEH